MASRAVAWLVKQYQCVFSRMRMREFLDRHPQLSASAGADVGPARMLFVHRRQIEQLEGRVLLASAKQVFYIDSDGASGVDYRGPVTVDHIDVGAFAAPAGLKGKSADILGAMLGELQEESTGSDVTFTSAKPTGTDFSTIYLGGDGSAFRQWGQYYGLAQHVDVGNQDHTDIGFVFSDAIAALGRSAAEYGKYLAGIVAHEAGHLMGLAHSEPAAADAGPLADVAFDPKVHVSIGADAMADVLDNGKVTIGGVEYAVHPKIVAALQNYPQFYNAGCVGPDGLPDSIMGQFVIHAEQHGAWVSRVMDMAWQAQSDPTYTPAQRSQILAFAYGYITHSTGDHWAHTLVNEFAEGVAPGFIAAAASIPTDQRDLGNMLRHFMTEAYIADALPGVDKNPDRTVLPGGDVSDDSTPGINYDAPIRFIYETFIRAFPGDPTHVAELNWNGATLTATAGANTFVRVSTSVGGVVGGLLGDSFKVGNKITVSGFSNPANNGTFYVTAVTDNALVSAITVDRPLVTELASGDETIVVNVPKTGVTTINVDPAAGTFTRTSGSFVADGFVPGMRFSAYGFNANFDNFIVDTVTPTVLKVIGKLNTGDGAGNGDEQLVVQGDRGPLLNGLIKLRDKLYKAAVSRGDRTGDNFAVQIGKLISSLVQGSLPPAPFASNLFKTYLYDWVDAIDDGLKHWGEFGLAFTKAMFDPQSRRDEQNKVGAKFGADTLANTARGDAENAVTFKDVLLAELDDPNGDGNTKDSFLTNHLLAMAGVPPQIGVAITAIRSFGADLASLLADQDTPFTPTQATKSDTETYKAGFIESLFKKRFGIDFQTFNVLKGINAKMDVKSVTTAGFTIPIFKPGDHERLDALMGLPASHHKPGSVDPIPGVDFYPGAEKALDDNASFDKNNFAAYQDSVTLTKMAMLMETPPDGSAVGAGQLSSLFSHLSGTAYDATKLNLHGAHGGNVLTATLPGVNGSQPWLVSIDADQVWRADSNTTVSSLFRVSTHNDSLKPAHWNATVTPGQYKVYVTWMANVTQDLPSLKTLVGHDQKIETVKNASYTVFDGTTSLGVKTQDQTLFASDIEHDGLGYALLGTFNIASGTLNIDLSNMADGNVIAGPVLLEAVSGGAQTLIANLRDPQTLAPLPPSNDYTDDPSAWTDLVYKTGGGNDPLWESNLLRDGFRAVFKDWRNGALQFPDLGDATSPDPNTTPIPKEQLPSLATPGGEVFSNTEFQIPIFDPVKNFILDGLDHVVSFVHSIESAPPLGVVLPGLNKSIASLLNLSGKIDESLRQPIVTYFNNDATPTFQELFDVVEAHMGGHLDSLDPVAEFDIDLRTLFQSNVALSLGAQASAAGLSLDGTLTADAAIKFVDKVIDDLPKLTLGFDFTPDDTIAVGDRVYIRADRALLSADIHATNLNFGANFGFVKAGIVNGTVDLTAAVSLVFKDPNDDGKITLGEVVAHPLSQLVDITATGTLSGNLPVHVDAGIGGFGNLDVGSLVFSASNVFDTATYDFHFNGDFSKLTDLSHVSFSDVLGMLNNVVSYLGKLEQFSFLKTKLPLINRSAGDLLSTASKFAAKVSDLQTNPAGSLQEVEAQIEDSFDITDPNLVQLMLDGHALKLKLNFVTDFSQDLPFDFDIASLPGLPADLASIFNLTGSGVVHVEGGASFGLNIGLDLANPSLPVPFLYADSTASLFAGVSTPTPLDFTLSVFGLSASINDGTVTLHKMGNIAENAVFNVGLIDSNTDQRLYFTDLTSLSASNISLSLNGAAELNFPVEFPPGTPLPPPLNISIPDLQALFNAAPNAVVVNSYPDFSALLDGLDLSGDLSGLLNSLDQLLSLLQAGMNNGAFAKKIPLIGDKLKDGANVIDRFRTDLLSRLQTFISSPGPKTVTMIQDELFQVLGPAGMDILQDGPDADTVVNASDVDIFIDDITDPHDVRFNVHIVKQAETISVPLGFDIGLPALGLSANGAVNVDAGFDLNIGFGFSKDAGVGPYLYVGNPNDLKVDVAVHIPGFSATGKLGFLQVDVNDDSSSPSFFKADFGFDLASPDDRLTVAEMNGAKFNASLNANAVADVNLKLAVSFGAAANFPRLLADLNLDWGFANASTASAVFGSAPHVAFNNIRLDLGSFFSGFASGVFGEIHKVLSPLQPLVDLLDYELVPLEKIGSVRNFFDVDKDRHVLVREVIHRLDPNPVLDFIDAISAFNNLVSAIPSSSTVILNLGSFNLDNVADLRGVSDLGTVPLTNVSEQNVAAQLSGNSQTQAFATALNDPKLGSSGGAGGGKFEIPLLQHPAQAFKLLMGQDVNLFQWIMPELSLDLSIEKDFPLLGPLEIHFGGEVGLTAHAGFGYDTSGLRAWRSSGVESKILDGFYLVDKDPSSSDDPAEIEAFGKITVGLGVDAGIASAHVDGSLVGTLNLNLNDPNNDGKVRLSELEANFAEGPLCIFDIDGGLFLQLSAHAKVGVWKLAKHFDYDSPLYELVSFSHECKDSATDPDPILATDIGGGVLRLNMGPYASERGSVNTDDGDESFTVAPDPNNAGGVIVTAFGFTQSFTGITQIFADGGAGNDTIAIDPSLNVTAVLLGGPGNDIITSGSGSATIVGDEGAVFGTAGNDLLTGGNSNDKLFGSVGNDTLIGGDGDDKFNGNDGNDVIYGEAGNDTINGDAGDDNLIGGDGNDSISGSDGSDTILGEAGDDILLGGAGNDEFDGGEGNDSALGGAGLDSIAGSEGNDTLDGGDDVDELDGGDGDDLITGGAGNDTADAGAGNDSITGGADNDLLDGGNNNDTIAGGTGADSITGGDNDDLLYGDEGNDLVSGNAGDDEIHGGADNDVLRGDSDNDTISGDGGDDLIVGGTENDTLFGNDGNDKMIGDDTIAGSSGNDSMDGGAGNDTLAGDNAIIDDVTLISGSGNDTIAGGDGDDLMYGQGGADLMSGGTGDDDMIGGTESDTMDGEAGNDVMLGDDGVVARDGSMIFNPDGTPRTAARQVTLSDGNGNDLMTGGADNDQMFGQAGNDTVSGDAGDDDMIGGQGNDLMNGGAGVDVMLGDDGTIATPINTIPARQPETNAILRTTALASSATDGNDEMHGGSDDDAMYGQGGTDLMTGDAGMDYIEGNQGADTISGGAGDDDMIGGSSVANTADGADVMNGDGGHDVMLGDNGRITRSTVGDQFSRATPGTPAGSGIGLEDNAVLRTVTLFADSESIGGDDVMNGGDGDDVMHGEVGNDLMNGNDGNDLMIGELGNDSMDGGAGNDGMLGDKGTLVPDLQDGSTQQTLSSQADKVSATVRTAGSIVWSATLIDAGIGGNDVMTGGSGDDAVHGGAGADILRGDAPNGTLGAFGSGGNDALFGDLGNDVLNGDGGADHVFGGGGDDNLDGGAGIDIVYGGDGNDTLIADVQDDRIIDWFGNFNEFDSPGPGSGGKTIIRSPNPAMRELLLALGAADGAVDSDGELQVVTPGSQGTPPNSGR